MITHNLFELLKAVALPPAYATARPKRLRLAIFTHVGQVVRHAHRLVVRILRHLWESLLRPGQTRLYSSWGAT